MAKSDGTAENAPEEEPRWGTWEELLLACAVNRHGTMSWDSVANELQKRSSVPTMLLSPENCKLKFLDLKRRFSSREVNGVVDDECGEQTDTAVPLLEVLRKLRVAELRREVERYDLSIVSLQLKVKTLTEERDRSLREDHKSDPAMYENREIRSEEQTEGDVEISPEPDAGEPVTGDKDQQSMNESNSTDQKGANARTSTKDEGKQLEAIRTGNVEDEPDKVKEEKTVREDSCNCSSNSVEKEPPVHEAVKTEPVTDSAELLESVAESKGGEENTKENSDVQSSASKSRKSGDADGGGANWRSSSGDERVNTIESPTVKEMPVEYLPLINFLEKIETHKYCSIFMRRLESQQTEDFKLLIRQHIDIKMVWVWLEEGRYLACKAKFFRDLLLLANNAIIFFRKNTSEFLAAMELRQLIFKEIPRAKLYSSSMKQKSMKLTSLMKEENSNTSDSLLLKAKQSGSLVICRKRSSITPKSSGSSSGVDKRREELTRKPDDDQPVTNSKQQPSQSVTNSGENRITKKRTRDRSSSVSTTSKKNLNSTIPNNNSAAVVEKIQGKRSRDPSPQNYQSKSENTSEKSSTDMKKRNAAKFLNRMKQSSSPNSGSLLDALKRAPLSADNKGGGHEKKRNGSGKNSGRKEAVSSKPPEANKSSGRPPKRGAAPSPQSRKRNLEVDHSESLASKQPKKRSRR